MPASTLPRSKRRTKKAQPKIPKVRTSQTGNAWVDVQGVISDKIDGITKPQVEPLGTCLLTGAVIAVMEQGDVPAHVT